MSEHERELQEALRRRLDAGLEALDAETLARLARPRREALSRLGQGRKAGWRRPLLAGGLALAAVAVLGLALLLERPQGYDPGAAPEGLEMLSSQDYDIAQDLDFYLWLEQQHGAS